MHKIKIYTLDQVQNKLIGEIGTPDRNKFEDEVQMGLLGNFQMEPDFTNMSIISITEKK